MPAVLLNDIFPLAVTDSIWAKCRCPISKPNRMYPASALQTMMFTFLEKCVTTHCILSTILCSSWILLAIIGLQCTHARSVVLMLITAQI
jgi:hypothetical protein